MEGLANKRSVLFDLELCPLCLPLGICKAPISFRPVPILSALTNFGEKTVSMIVFNRQNPADLLSFKINCHAPLHKGAERTNHETATFNKKICSSPQFNCLSAHGFPLGDTFFLLARAVLRTKAVHIMTHMHRFGVLSCTSSPMHQHKCGGPGRR